MIYLIFTICFANGICTVHEMPTDARSVVECMLRAQPTIAQNYPEKPGQTIYWQCRAGQDL